MTNISIHYVNKSGANKVACFDNTGILNALAQFATCTELNARYGSLQVDVNGREVGRAVYTTRGVHGFRTVGFGF